MPWNDKAVVDYANELAATARRRIHKDLFDGLPKGVQLAIPRRVKVEFFTEPTMLGGITSSWLNLIVMNREMIRENGYDCAVDLIGHEVAHLVTDKLFSDVRTHGKEWKAVARWFGARPYALHNYPCDSVGAGAVGKFFLWTDASGKHHDWLSSKLHYQAIRDGAPRYTRVGDRDVRIKYNPKKEDLLRRSHVGVAGKVVRRKEAGTG